MNTIKIASLIFITVGISSCLNKAEVKAPKTAEELKVQFMLEGIKKGGQPGEIILNGLAAASTGDGAEARITMEQKIGSPSEGTTLADRSEPKFNPEARRKEGYSPSTSGQYLNVGCELQDDARIAGLTEKKNVPDDTGITATFGTAARTVDKIFICGKVAVTENVIMMNANEIYLTDVEILKENQFGIIGIETNLLVIEGSNLILTTGFDNNFPSFFYASDISVSVYETLNGNGRLDLKSIGGNYVAKTTK